MTERERDETFDVQLQDFLAWQASNTAGAPTATDVAARISSRPGATTIALRLAQPRLVWVVLAILLIAALVGLGVVGAGLLNDTTYPQRLTTNELPLAAGIHTAGQPFVVPVTFAVPDGWTGKIDGPYAVFLRRGETEIAFARIAEFYQDPCHPERGLLYADSGNGMATLAGTISAAPGFEARYQGRVDNHMGYFGDGWGNELTITAPASSADCPMAANGYPIWQVQPYGYPVGFISNEDYKFDPGPGVTPSLPMGATRELLAGRTDHISSFQVESEHFLIDYTLADESDAALLAEVNAILDSVQINVNQ
jgi:hypothetical protein